MTKYFNIKNQYGTETIDQIDSEEFKTYKEFRKELSSMLKNYRMLGYGVYLSQRPCKDWK